MAPEHAAAVIDRLVADLARATGHQVEVIRLSYGLDPETAVADLPEASPLVAA